MRRRGGVETRAVPSASSQPSPGCASRCRSGGTLASAPPFPSASPQPSPGCASRCLSTLHNIRPVRFIERLVVQPRQQQLPQTVTAHGPHGGRREIPFLHTGRLCPRLLSGRPTTSPPPWWHPGSRPLCSKLPSDFRVERKFFTGANTTN